MEMGKRKRSSSTEELRHIADSLSDLDKQAILKRHRRPASTPIESDYARQNSANVETNPVDESSQMVLETDIETDFTAASKEPKPDAIKMALDRITALQDELKMDSYEDESDSDTEIQEYIDDDMNFGIHNVDAKVLGFIACAQETMKYLADQGIPRDNPMMINLRNRLIEGINRI